jgi:Iap family predicted aminopeptidase
MKATATLRLAFADEAEAKRMMAALAPENGRYLSARVEANVLVLEGDADGALALLHTLDDALACLSAAEKAGRLARA